MSRRTYAHSIGGTELDDEELQGYRQRVRAANSHAFELAEQGDVQSLISLLHSPLKTENISVRFSALMHLGKMGSNDAIPHITPLLGDEDHTIRAGAIVALTRLGASDAASRVAAALDDPHPGVRQRAAESLALLGSNDVEFTSALSRALEDDVWHVRREALKTLAVLRAVDSIPAIEASKRNERPWRRRHANTALRLLRAKTGHGVGAN